MNFRHHQIYISRVLTNITQVCRINFQILANYLESLSGSLLTPGRDLMINLVEFAEDGYLVRNCNLNV